MMRNLLFILLAACLFSCKKEPLTPAVLSPEDITISATERIYAEIDGNEHYYIDSKTNEGIGVGRGHTKYRAADSATYHNYIASFYKDISAGNRLFTITRGDFNVEDKEITNELFKHFFEPGNYDLTLNSPGGFEIIYHENNEKWSTSFGDQTESTFTIEETREETYFDSYSIKIKAKFSCKVYDDNGNEKQITDGIVVVSFANLK